MPAINDNQLNMADGDQVPSPIGSVDNNMNGLPLNSSQRDEEVKHENLSNEEILNRRKRSQHLYNVEEISNESMNSAYLGQQAVDENIG